MKLRWLPLTACSLAIVFDAMGASNPTPTTGREVCSLVQRLISAAEERLDALRESDERSTRIESDDDMAQRVGLSSCKSWISNHNARDDDEDVDAAIKHFDSEYSNSGAGARPGTDIEVRCPGSRGADIALVLPMKELVSALGSCSNRIQNGKYEFSRPSETKEQCLKREGGQDPADLCGLLATIYTHDINLELAKSKWKRTWGVFGMCTRSRQGICHREGKVALSLADPKLGGRRSREFSDNDAVVIRSIKIELKDVVGISMR